VCYSTSTNLVEFKMTITRFTSDDCNSLLSKTTLYRSKMAILLFDAELLCYKCIHLFCFTKTVNNYYSNYEVGAV
jgi:hypothetical protein